jgi:hypothetical protein
VRQVWALATHPPLLLIQTLSIARVLSTAYSIGFLLKPSLIEMWLAEIPG